MEGGSETLSLRNSDNSVISILSIWLFGTMCLWFFAFYSDSAGTPDWVRRAQVACFGSNELGLPSAGGWILLTLSPIALLVSLYVALGDEIRTAFSQLRESRKLNIIFGIVILLVTVEINWVAFKIYEKVSFSQGIDFRNDPETLPDSYPVLSLEAPDFTLVDQTGNNLSLSSFAGKPVLLSFVFAHCASVCPTLVNTVNTASKQLGPDKVKTLLITLDPWRDTPASLPGLAKKWSLAEGVSVLSASPEQVQTVLDAYNVPRQRDLNSGDVAHPALVHVINPEGKITYSFNDPSASWLVQAITRITK